MPVANRRTQLFFYFAVGLYLVAIGLNSFFLAQSFAMDTNQMWLHIVLGFVLVGIGYVMSTKWVRRVYPSSFSRR